MMQRLKEPPSLQEFVGGKRDKAAELARCISAWDRVDRALARNN